MADRLALVIGLESYQDAALPPVAFAEADAAAFAQLLTQHGFAREEQVVLLGSQATRTAIESKLRKLVKHPPSGETLFFFYSGQAFADAKQGYLTCFDSQLDDLLETSVTLQSILDALAGGDWQRIALFLDAHAGLPADKLPAGIVPHLPVAQLAEFCRGPHSRVCFTSCLPGEMSSASAVLKHGIWAHHLLEALGGKAPLALENGRVLTAASLHNHLLQEMPRTLRSTFRDARVQTPGLFADPDRRFLVADVGPLLDQTRPNADPRLQPLKRGALRAETSTRVKALSGFRKFHHLPDRVNASSQKFVSDLAAEDIKADVDACYSAVREHLGYKRRDVDASSERGAGFVRTPDFEYTVSVELASDDPTTVVWRREVASIRTPEVVLGKAFQSAFGDIFDTLVFEFVKPFDLETWVDRVEDEMPEGVKVRCASDCSSCDVSVMGFAGVIRLRRDRVEIQARKSPGSKGLVEAFLQFQDLFAGKRDLQALPLNSAS
jgi:hypothetical protein